MFDERTIDRGIDYYLNGHVLETRSEGSRVTGTVAGTRAKPYSVVVDTERFERSVCTCPVGHACKHLVAVVVSMWNDERSEPALRARVARFAKSSGLLDELVDTDDAPDDDEPGGRPDELHVPGHGGADFTIDLEAEIRDAEDHGAGTTDEHAEGPRSAPPRYLESSEQGTWRLALLVDGDAARRPQVSLVRQYRRRDGVYGRVEAYRDDEPVFVPDAAARDLAERLRVFRGAAPVVAFANEVAATTLPVFAGRGPLLSSVQETPVRVVRPIRFDVEVVPVAAERPWVGDDRGGREPGFAVTLSVGMDVTAGRAHYAVSPGSHCAVDAGLGVVVASFARDDGLILISDEESPLSTLCRWFTSGSTVAPAAVAGLHALAERYPESVSVRSPRRVRVTEHAATPVFTLASHSSELSAWLELEEQQEADGYSGEEYVVHVHRLTRPDRAIAAASKLIGSYPDDHSPYGYPCHEACGPWVWDQPIRRGTPDLLTVARGLAELDYTVYIWTADGKRRVRRSRTLSVSVGSGTDWFAPVVTESGAPPLDMLQMHELTARGALDDGENLVLFSPAETERIRRLLELADGLPDGRFPKADLVSLADLAELADEMPPDLEPVRELATAIVSGKKPPPPRTPAGLTANLRPYQQEGFAWLASLARHGLSGCLADDMGLGKTVQALALMLHLLETDPGDPSAPDADDDLVPGGFVVIAPVSTLGNWRREAARFAPELVSLIHHGGTRATETRSLAEADLVLTSYATAMRDVELLAGVRWRLAVLDEAQAVKNPRARTTKRVKQLPAGLRLCLTGTPVENVSTDLWSIMDFLVPGLLGSLPVFGRRFPKRNVSGSEQAADKLARLRRIVAPFMLRRTKEAVAPELPPKIETVLACEMGSRQATFYETLRVHHHGLVQRAIASGDICEIGAAVFTGLLRLRQAAIHPPSADPTGRAVPSIKEEELLAQLDETSQEGHRALVFSQFVSALATFRDRAAERGVKTLYLDGQTHDRDTLIDSFQHSQDPCVFFISLRAGGTGINLTAADHVFICDPWWNPQVERQAVDRAHRIGREQPVIVTRLVTSGTIEQKVLELQEQKRALAADLISENAGGIDLKSGEELLALFERD